MTETHPDHARLTAEFDHAMHVMCDRFKTEISYNPTAFRAMIDEHGGLEAARRLLTGPQAQSGLERLWQEHRLGESVVAHVLDSRFASLFSAREKRIARQRLEAHGYSHPG